MDILIVKIVMKYILNQYILPSKQIIRERIEPTILFLFIPIFNANIYLL